MTNFYLFNVHNDYFNEVEHNYIVIEAETAFQANNTFVDTFAFDWINNNTWQPATENSIIPIELINQLQSCKVVFLNAHDSCQFIRVFKKMNNGEVAKVINKDNNNMYCKLTKIDDNNYEIDYMDVKVTMTCDYMNDFLYKFLKVATHYLVGMETKFYDF